MADFALDGDAGAGGGGDVGDVVGVGVVAVDEGPAEALGFAQGGEGAESFGVDEVGVLLAPEELEAGEVPGDGGAGDAEFDGDLGLGEAALAEAGDFEESLTDVRGASPVVGGDGVGVWGGGGHVHGFGGSRASGGSGGGDQSVVAGDLRGSGAVRGDHLGARGIRGVHMCAQVGDRDTRVMGLL